jgi:hypothetical protein
MRLRALERSTLSDSGRRAAAVLKAVTVNYEVSLGFAAGIDDPAAVDQLLHLVAELVEAHKRLGARQLLVRLDRLS